MESKSYTVALSVEESKESYINIVKVDAVSHNEAIGTATRHIFDRMPNAKIKSYGIYLTNDILLINP